MFAERYQNLGKLKYAYAIPNPNGTTESDRWQHISQALLSAVATGILPDPVIIYGRLISAYRSGDVDGFNQVIREYREYLERTIPQEVKRSQLEFFFNQAQPFLQAMALYFIVFLFRSGLLAQVAENTWQNCCHSPSVCISPSHGWACHKDVLARPAAGHQPVQLGDFCWVGSGSALPVSGTLL